MSERPSGRDREVARTEEVGEDKALTQEYFLKLTHKGFADALPNGQTTKIRWTKH